MRGRCWLSYLANNHLVLFANPEFVVFVGTTIEFEALSDGITVHQMREIFPFTSGSTTGRSLLERDPGRYSTFFSFPGTLVSDKEISICR